MNSFKTEPRCALTLALLMTGWMGGVQAQTSTAVEAAEGQSPVSLPFGECGAGYWSSNRNLDDKTEFGSVQCQLNWRPKLGEDLRLGVSLRVGSQDVRASDGASQRLREGYLDFDTSVLSVRLGRQLIAWGRADRINPTDSLSPRDFTLLTPDDELQRNGIDAVKLRFALGTATSVTGVVTQFSPHVTPQGANPSNLVKPDSPTAPEWALKLDHTSGGVDWSVSYFDGFERSIRYQLDSRNPKAPVFRGDFERVQKIGGDFATAQGAWTWRGEFAHSKLMLGCALCVPAERALTSLVLGGDVDFLETMNVNVQLFANWRDSFVEPNGPPGLQQTLAQGLNRLNSEYAGRDVGLTFRLSDRLLNDRLKWELSAVLDLTGQSSVIRPRLTYSFNDKLRINAGFDIFDGPSQSYFGALNKNTLAFMTLNWVF